MASSGEPEDGWIPGGPVSDVELESSPWGPLRAFVRDSVPETLRGARLDPGTRGALLLGGLALVAALTAVVLAWTAAARPATATSVAAPKVSVPPPSDGTSTTAVPATTAASASSAPLVVDVAGKVHRPGLVRLPAGARVADAIARAGGVLPGTSTVGMSLARRLVDGEQLLVGQPQAPSGAVSSTSSSTPGDPSTAGGVVDLNTATVSDLDALPGIGPVLAQRIVDWRTQHGGFSSVDQLEEVSGLGGHKYQTLAPLVRV